MRTAELCFWLPSLLARCRCGEPCEDRQAARTTRGLLKVVFRGHVDHVPSRYHQSCMFCVPALPGIVDGGAAPRRGACTGRFLLTPIRIFRLHRCAGMLSWCMVTGFWISNSALDTPSSVSAIVGSHVYEGVHVTGCGMGLVLDSFGLPGLRDAAGVLQYDHRDGARRSRQVVERVSIG